MTVRRGFTLIEVLLAMVIAVVLLTVLAQAMASASREESQAERRATAVLLAERRLSELESRERSMTQSVQQAACEEDQNFLWEMEAGGAGDLREVTVRIRWAADGRELVKVVRLLRERR
jgi:prepilin-type N-terminal cleavage/methylation domain-containing protein